MTFRVGERVICIEDRPNTVLGIPPPSGYFWDINMSGLTRLKIYTIRSVGCWLITGREGVRLLEIIRPLESDGTEPTFASSRFRKLVTSTLEADTTAFLRIANSVDSIVRADLMERDMSEVEAELNRYDLP